MNIVNLSNFKKSNEKKQLPVVVKDGKKVKVQVKDPSSDWEIDPMIDAGIEIAANCFSHLLKWFAKYPDKEISGYGAINSENVIDWVLFTSVGNAGGVVATDSQMAKAIEAAAEDGRSITLHFHTHPGMDAYWSTTDNRMQDKLAKLTNPSDWTYIVYNGISWISRRIVNNNGKITYNDGLVTLCEAKIPLPSDYSILDSHRWTKVGNEWYQESYGYNYYPYNYNYRDKKEKDSKKEELDWSKSTWSELIIDAYDSADYDSALDGITYADSKELAEIQRIRPDVIEGLNNYKEAHFDSEENIDKLIRVYISGNYKEAFELFERLTEDEIVELGIKNYDVLKDLFSIKQELEEAEQWSR